MPCYLATTGETKGSCPTTVMPKARARRATSIPIRPSPTIPNVLPRSSVPCSDFFSHLPACIHSFARHTCRAIASIMASVCSATATAFAPGVFITAIPLRVAASRSMLSTPTPARPITRNLCACSSSPASTCTAERTINASADCNWVPSLPSTWSGVTTVHRGSRNKSTAEEEIFSATTTFIPGSRPYKEFPIPPECRITSESSEFAGLRVPAGHLEQALVEPGPAVSSCRTSRPGSSRSHSWSWWAAKLPRCHSVVLSASRARVHLLRRPHRTAVLHFVSRHRSQHLLERRQDPDRIQVVVIPQVRDAEQLAFHLPLPVGHRSRERLAELFHHSTRIQPVGRLDRGQRRRRSRRRVEPQSQGLRSGSRHRRRQLRIVDQRLASRPQISLAHLAHEIERGTERGKQRGRGSVRRLSLGRRLAFLAKIEIVPRRPRRLHPLPRPVAEGAIRQPRRNHQRFLRSPDDHVNPPAIHIEVRRAQSGDGVDHEQRLLAGRAHQLRDPLHIMTRPGRTLRRLYIHRPHLGRQPCANFLQRERVAIRRAHLLHHAAKSLCQIAPALAKLARSEHQHSVAW